VIESNLDCSGDQGALWVDYTPLVEKIDDLIGKLSDQVLPGKYLQKGEEVSWDLSGSGKKGTAG
jgi:hypothetical protein